MVIPCIEAVELPVIFQPAFGAATCDLSNYSNYRQESEKSQALLKGKTEKNREKPAYRMLEDVQDGLNSHFAVNVVYKTICRYLGLPEVFENVLKARKEDEDEPLILNGRVIFSPETGEPLKKRDWNRLIEAIETYLKRKLKEEDKRLVMRNTAVAKIIARRNGYKKCPRKTRAKGQDHKGDLPSNSTIPQSFDSVKKNSEISSKPQTDAQMKAEKEKTQKAREKAGLPKRELFVCESMGRRAVRSLLDRF